MCPQPTPQHLQREPGVGAGEPAGCGFEPGEPWPCRVWKAATGRQSQEPDLRQQVEEGVTSFFMFGVIVSCFAQQNK